MALGGNGKRLARNASAVAFVIVLLLLTWSTVRSGLASLLTTYAANSSQIGPANAAVVFDKGNPDAHYIRATILAGTDLPASVSEYEQAALSRPDDYVLWLSLARARELNGDPAGAVSAARQAVPLAPYYGEPHYQLGNILLRAGQREEAFKELRLAGASNPTLMPGIIDCAAIAMYAAAGSAADEDRNSYLRELIGARRFKDAASLWLVVRGTAVAPGVMIDPGFEQESNLDGPGFGWRLGEKRQGFRLALDTNNPREGRSSLKVDFSGDSDPSSPVISQLVLIEPGSHYQLHFAMRSENIVSGGPPLVMVVDADTGKPLKPSEPFPTATNGWREYVIAFDSGPSATAVGITLQRQACDQSPCPIFGRLWLDSFSLQKL